MASDEEEDDYLNMTFDDVGPARKETSLQRTARLKREAAERGKIAPKAEREATAEEAREKALATQLDSSNKGAQMLAKMGFKGGGLGKTAGARTRPIEVQMKADRGGLGMENEKKRKLREAADALDIQEKRIKISADEYRERSRVESEEKRREGQMWSAMRTLEGFESEEAPRTDGFSADGDGEEASKKSGQTVRGKHPPLRSINVLRRSLVKQRLDQERERRIQSELAQSLSRREDYNDSDSEAGHELQAACGNEIEEEADEKDAELDEFDSLSFGERLDRILEHLRKVYHYCFWCKYRYLDEEMDGCPGVAEDEHG